MRLTILALVTVFAFGVGVAAQAVQQPKPVPTFDGKTIRVDQTVTVRFQDADAAAVLMFLGKTAGVEIRFAPDVKATTPITLDVQNAQVAEVFKAVVRLAALDYEVIDEKTVLVSQRQP